jgi:hypothetical protein
MLLAWLLLVMNEFVLVPWIIIVTSAVCSTAMFNRELKRETFVLLAGTCLATSALYFVMPSDAVTQFMFVYRADHFVSGLSPNLPLLFVCGGVLWWLWFQLAARSTFDVRRPLLPRGDGLAQIPTHDRFGNAGSARTLLFTRQFGIVAIVGGVALCFQNWRLHSLEGAKPDLVYNIASCITLLLFLNCLYGAWVYWRRCRDLLIALSRTPLRYTFEEISGFEWR